jgi:hypothetical protein
MSSPTQRSKAHAESMGYQVAIVEKWNPWAKIRQDLFGFGDLLCMKEGHVLVLIQTTTTGNMKSRIQKIHALPTAWKWITTGNKIEVWGWAIRGKKGTRKKYELKRHIVTGNDLAHLAGEQECV